MLVKFEILETEDGYVSETSVTDQTEQGIDEVIRTVVRGLLGATYPESLIKQYINYDSDNYIVRKIGETDEEVV